MSETQDASPLRPLLPILPLMIYVCAPLGAVFAVLSRWLPHAAQPAGLMLAWMLIAVAAAAGVACIVVNAVNARAARRHGPTTGSYSG